MPREDPFGDFYRRHHGPMVRLAYLLTQSQAAAEDLVHDAFMRLQPRWGRVEQPLAYLRRAVVNACNSWHRRQRVERAHLDGAPPGPPPVFEEPDEMWDALGGLAPRRRAVLVLRFYADLSEAATARALGCRPGTVKSLTSRALADLRRVLEP
ncbi:MAG: SigE family RNA polymerase sigma factor [Acidimicrobiales bacterium]